MEDSLSAEEKRMLTQVTELLEKNGKLERAENESSFFQIPALRNDTDFDLQNVSFRVEFYDEQGTMLGNASDYVESWSKGKTVSLRFYCGSAFDSAKVRAVFDAGSDRRLKTEYLKLVMGFDEQ